MGKIKLLFGIVIIALVVSACCNCGSGEENIVKGIITVVGNEPFTKLAIRLDNNKAYILECKKDIEKELLKQQGNYYAIQFSSSRVEEGVPILKVEVATPLNFKTKN